MVRRSSHTKERLERFHEYFVTVISLLHQSPRAACFPQQICLKVFRISVSPKGVLRLPVSWCRWLNLSWPTVVYDHQEARNLSRVLFYKGSFLTNLINNLSFLTHPGPYTSRKITSTDEKRDPSKLRLGLL